MIGLRCIIAVNFTFSVNGSSTAAQELYIVQRYHRKDILSVVYGKNPFYKCQIDKTRQKLFSYFSLLGIKAEKTCFYLRSRQKS